MRPHGVGPGVRVADAPPPHLRLRRVDRSRRGCGVRRSSARIPLTRAAETPLALPFDGGAGGSSTRLIEEVERSLLIMEHGAPEGHMHKVALRPQLLRGRGEGQSAAARVAGNAEADEESDASATRRRGSAPGGAGPKRPRRGWVTHFHSPWRTSGRRQWSGAATLRC